MKCLNCNKEFVLEQCGSGGHNRDFCYECLPVIKGDRNARSKQRRALLAVYSDKVKLERGCKVCGYNKCAKALEWHHPNSDKDADPSVLLKTSLKHYLQEIEKCELLCANCHREEHERIKSESGQTW